MHAYGFAPLRVALLSRVANRSTHPGTLCVGPINEYYVRRSMPMPMPMPRSMPMPMPPKPNLPIPHAHAHGLSTMGAGCCTPAAESILSHSSCHRGACRLHGISRRRWAGCSRPHRTARAYTRARLDDRYSSKQRTTQRAGDTGARKLLEVLGKMRQRSDLNTSESIEVVSNCHPWAMCEKALAGAYGARVVLHNSRQRAAAELGMAQSNSEMMYDILRCARCPHPLLVSSRGDVYSSFFSAIDMVHAQWHGVANYNGTRVLR